MRYCGMLWWRQRASCPASLQVQQIIWTKSVQYHRSGAAPAFISKAQMTFFFTLCTMVVFSAMNWRAFLSHQKIQVAQGTAGQYIPSESPAHLSIQLNHNSYRHNSIHWRGDHKSNLTLKAEVMKVWEDYSSHVFNPRACPAGSETCVCFYRSLSLKSYQSTQEDTYFSVCWRTSQVFMLSMLLKLFLHSNRHCAPAHHHLSKGLGSVWTLKVQV